MCSVYSLVPPLHPWAQVTKVFPSKGSYLQSLMFTFLGIVQISLLPETTLSLGAQYTER
jgi:hypothetical protein